MVKVQAQIVAVQTLLVVVCYILPDNWHFVVCLQVTVEDWPQKTE